jgi:zinc transport system substrate-binding protein
LRLPALALALLPFAAEAEVPRVVTDIGPTQSLAAGVMQGLGRPDVLVGAGADPHHFQMRPSEARLLAGADVVFWIGADLTPWLADMIAAIAPDSLSVELAHAEGVTQRPPQFADPDGAETAPEDGHSHGSDDPHIWLDPANARAMTREVAARLSTLDPDNADAYAANAVTVIAALDRAEAEAQALLAPHRSAPLVVWHDGYAHFAAAFGVNIAAAIAESDAAGPGAAQLSALRAAIEAEGARCIFDEPQHGKRAVAAVAADTGVPRGTLDPLAAGDVSDPGAVILGLARAIDACLGGG